MSDVAVIGSPELVSGFALAGARTYAVRDAEEARATWQHLPPTVAVVLLSAAAADAIGEATGARGAPLTVRLPS
ncbi:V-type ATP synthase subunit F [Cellulomonas sp. SG140]|uniref:V-type ATP synthase subunit F n=1 Tax=Cellulomonas sp. SG140 TaxID=2976536 RepID=UPI0021E807A3|nr:V-type ATP synthase subunit F [Cellulomonas sp. SG140]